MKKIYTSLTKFYFNSANYFAGIAMTFTLFAATAGFAQTCNPDTEAPTVINAPQDVNVQCVADVPPPPNVMFTDNCDNDVDVFFHEMGPATGDEKCEIFNASGGQFSNTWALWLPNLPNGLTDKWLISAGAPGCLDIYADSTARFTGRAYAVNNPALYFDMDVRIKDKKDWDTWSNLLTISAPFINRSFKDDNGVAVAGGNLQTTWDYYVLDNAAAVLIGGGGLSGTYLTLEHAPSNLYYGCQVGQAANNTSGNFGLSTWFTYTGFFNLNGSISSVSGLGDFNFKLICGPNVFSTCEQTINRVWIAIDDSGNTTSVTQTITVEDTLPPVLSDCPEDTGVECDNVPSAPTLTADDNCDGPVTVNFEEQMQAGSCDDSYSLLRHWWATDNCGNQVDCFQTIIVSDTTAPILSDDPADMTLECDESVPTALILTASDNCDDDVHVIFTETTIAGNCPNASQIIRTWTATDDCGNSSSVDQTITIEDTTNPTLNGVPANATVSCDNIPMAAPVTGSDNCGGAMVAFNEVILQGTGCQYQIIRTWTATDACGNQFSDSQTITVVDSEAPTFDNTPSDENASCDNVPSAPIVTASDNCSSASVSFSETNNGEECPMIITRTWTATDDCGNSNSISQIITVTDDVNPILSGGSSGFDTYDCGENPPTPIAPTATDNCDTDVTITLVVESVDPTCPGGPDGTKYTWTAADNCNNTATQSYTVQAVDNEAPVLSNCPTDITVECEGEIPAPPIVTATDNCDNDVDVAFVEFFNLDGSEATCVATDAEGEGTNNNLWSLWLPNLPGGITDEFIWNDENGSFNEFEDYAILQGTVHAANNPNQIFFLHVRFENKVDWTTWNGQSTLSNPPMPRSFKDDSGFAAAGGNLWTTWDYYTIDPTESYLIGAGEFAGSMLTLTQAPANLLFGVQVGQAANNTNSNFGLSTWFLYSGTLLGQNVQGLGDFNIDLDCGPGNLFSKCNYDVTRIWIATDNCGNSTTCIQTIDVIDTTAPVFDNLPQDELITCEEAVPAAPLLTATDNCGLEVTISMQEQTLPGLCPNESVIQRIWIAADCCQNTTSVSQTITITDVIAPVIIPAANATLECTDLIPAPSATASDTCGDATWTVDESFVGDCGNTGVWTRVYTATDDCGNTATATQTITIIDTTAPSITADIDATIECTDPIPAPSATASDTCGDATWTVDESFVGECGNTGVWTRVYTATDDCGNTATATQTITIIDTAPPSITADINATIECTDPIPAPSATASDTCGDATWTVDESFVGDCGNTGVWTRVYTATDDCGNTATATQTITIIDTTPPSITADINETIECTDPIPAPSATASDTCGDATWTVDESFVGDCGNTGVWTRVYTATDDCGNTATATQTITIIDTTPPSITADIDATVECTDPIPTPSAIASDTCGDATWTVDESFEGDCGNTGVWTRLYTATDDCGNTATATQTITIIDTAAPSITADLDATVECTDPIPAPSATASDTCGDATWTVDESFVGDCGNTGVWTRVYTATDDCGNTATATQTITIIDTTAPSITADIDATVECTDPIPTPSATASDTCGDATWTVDESFVGDCGNTGVWTRVYTATDDCGNTATATQTITIVDTTPPFVQANPDVTIECGDPIPPSGYQAYDTCGDVTVALSMVTPPGCGNTKQIIRTYTVTDECGNVSTDQQVITIIDTTPPTIVPADDETVECSEPLPAPAAVASDTCGEATWTVDETFVGDCGNTGVYTRVYTAEDECGNTASAIQTITVIDTTAPTLTVAASLALDCGDPIPEASAVASDTCGDATWTVVETIEEGCITIITRVYTATDDCQNTTSATQTITITDTTAPTLTVGPDLTLECDEPVPGPSYDEEDDCNNVLVTVDEVITPGACAQEYTLVRTYTATDDCGNTSSATQTITVQDTTPPTMDDPSIFNLDVECDVINGQELNDYANGLMTPAEENVFFQYARNLFYQNGLVPTNPQDNCDTDPIIQETDLDALNCDQIACPAIGQLACTFAPIDECGNIGLAITTTITLIDVTAPVLDGVPADVTVECDNIPAEPIVSATDDCFGAQPVEMSQQLIPGNCPGNYTLVRTWTSSDKCNNTASGTQTIIVQDTTAPIFTSIPQNGTFECDSVPGPDAPDATDNCTLVSVSTSEEIIPGDCENHYFITYTYTASDECDNSVSVSHTYEIQDTTAPEFDSLPPVQITVSCDEIPDPSELTATDNCDEDVVIMYMENMYSGTCAGSLERIWVAKDNCGNETTFVQYVTLIDDEAPIFSQDPDDVTIECDQDLPAPIFITVSDNCAQPTMTYSEEEFPGACPQEYSIVRTYTAEDNCNNVASVSYTVFIVDTTAPVFTSVAADMTLECDETIPEPSSTANDNCGMVMIDFSEVNQSGSCPQEYTLIRTYTASDECGNVSTATQTIVVVDTTPPVLSPLPQDETVECDDDLRADDIAANDNCSGALPVQFTEEFIPGSCEFSYQLIRTWSAIDECGNEASHTMTLTVEDTTAPEFTNFPVDEIVECDSVPAPSSVVTAIDNCDDAPVITFDEVTEPGACPQESFIYRTWTVTDDCGNATSQTQAITVIDTTAPVLTIAADVTIECDEPTPAPNYTATDNCSDPIVTVTEVDSGDSCEKIITRTYTADDGCGNTTTAVQVITIVDTTAPTLNIAADITLECGEDIPVPSSTSADNCNDYEVVVTEVITEMCGLTYTLERTYVATDFCGNSTSAIQTIIVEDTTAPTITADISVTIECTDSIPAPSASASDSCGDATWTVDESFVGDCGNTGVWTRVYTATDDCGNTATATQTITIIDTTPPIVVANPDETIECGEPIPPSGYDAYDTCGDITVTLSMTTPPGCGGTKQIIRVYTVTDDCGNVATDQQIITIVDTTDPFFTSPIPTDVEVECDAVPAAPVIGAGGITADDVCSDVTINFAEQIIDGDCIGSYTIIRTWTAIDDCGNMTSESQTITVVDTTPPTFENIPSDASVECDNVPPADMVTATDNCDSDIEVIYNELFFSGGCVGVLQRTWTATDDCGNQSSFMQFVTLLDNTPPVLEDAPADASYDCSEIVPEAPQLNATDNCTEVVVTFEEVLTPGSCPQNYTLTRTWIATDNCDNEATHVQTITVTDTTAPTFTFVAADETIECDETIPDANATATDDCGMTTVSLDEVIVDGSCPNNYTINRTYTATDDCGNTATATQTITVQDTTAPIFSGAPSDITVSCGEVPAPMSPTATDNCGDVTVSFSQFGYNGVDCSGILTRVWTAEDECGNTSSVTQLITIIDEIAPEFSDEPADITVECDSVPAAASLTATDNCDTDVIVVMVETTVDGNCTDSYVLIRTWTATDDCNNSSSHTQTITVIDSTAPIFVDMLPETMDVPCDSIPSVADITAVDNCDNDVIITFTEQNLSSGCGGAIKRTWVATDNCGNSSTFDQFLFLMDEVNPVATVPANYTVECDEDLLPFEDATAVDNCDDDLDVTFSETNLPGICAGAQFIIRAWTFTDNCQNSTTVSQTISIVDTTAPILSGTPADVTVECGNVPPVATVVSTDACGQPDLVYSESIIDGNCPETYTIIRTWTATDACGNSTSASQTIEVQDTTAPIISGTFDNDLVSCENVPGIPVASASDNCDMNVDLEFSEVITPGACTDAYTISRTWTASDNCGNTSSVSQTIEVIDNTAPILTGLPADETVECGNIPAVPNVGGTDNCDSDVEITLSQFGYNGTDCSGTLERVWMATDNCGNTSSYTQVITIVDTTDPIFDTPLPVDMTVECDAVPAAEVVTATDNCGDAIIVLNETSTPGNCDDSYTLSRTWTATDECGNSIQYTQTIYVTDTTAPIFVDVPADSTIDCQDMPDAEDVTVTDNCDNDVFVTVNEMIFSGGCVGVIQRTYTAVDNCGNTSEYTQFITLTDTTAPVMDGLPSDETVECDNIPSIPVVTVSDNCDDDVMIEFDESTSGTGCDYTITRTWTAEDACMNIATHVQTITVTDSQPPVIIGGPANATVMCDDIPDAAIVTATDNCSNATVTMTEVTSDGCPYQIERTYTAIDDCGNTSTHTQILDVIDDVNPTFNMYPADETADCGNIPAVPNVTASDNCDADVEVVLSMNQVITACETIITRTWVATDACGNTATHTQTITLVDTTAPTFDLSTVPADILPNNSVTCSTIPAASTPTASDDCHAVTITMEESEEEVICPGTYTLVRTWTANDGCGNTSSVSQSISIIDSFAPEFLTFPEDETYVCGDEIPDPVMPTVQDGCSSTTLTLEETIVGQTELNPACELLTPVQNIVGEEWSVFLPGVASGYFILDSNNGIYQEVDLGGGVTEGVFTGRVYDSVDSCKAFYVEGFMINKLDWATWSSLLTVSPPYVNRSFKDDGGFAAAIGGNIHETWEYWELDNSRTILVGDGCYLGDTLQLLHAPSNLFYGFQVGLAANNRNDVFGMGTWFSYNGEIDGENVNGVGDFGFRMECPPCEYTITRTWTATDDCGNSVSQSQIITVTDPDNLTSGGTGVIADNDFDSDATFSSASSASKFDFKMSASPNPTSDMSSIKFLMNEYDKVRLDVFSMKGQKVAELYSGPAEKDQVYRFDFDASSLSTGIYIYRLTTENHGVFQDKIIITK